MNARAKIEGDGNSVGNGSVAQTVKAERSTVSQVAQSQIRADIIRGDVVTAGRDVIQEAELRVAEDWLGQISRTLNEWLSATVFRRRYLQRYYQTLLTNLRELRVIGKNRPLDLERIYIALRISDYVPRGMVPDARPEEAQKRILPTLAERYAKAMYVEQALMLGQRLAILGEPGSGKTTLLRHLALRIGKTDVKLRTFVEELTGNAETSEVPEYPLPILVTLNDFARSNQRLTEYLASVLAEYGFPYAGRYLRQQIERGRCLLLLDGLDEVAVETEQDRVIGEINAFVKKYANYNQVIVTSRIAGFRHLLHESFIQLEVVEFGQKDIESFVHNWFVDQPERVEGLLAALRKSRRMQALAANPLLLSIITVVYEQGWRLPERRVDLYEECANVLCEKWDQIRGLSRPSLYRPKWQIVLEDLAYQFFTQEPPKFIFSEQELLEALSVILPQHSIRTGDAHRFLSEVMEQTGLLRRKSRTTFDFVHLTFHEYFAARAIARHGKEEIALAHYGEPQWQEVILLLAGIMRDATPLIDCILAEGRMEPERLVLATRCLVDADQTEPTRRQVLIDWILDQLVRSDEITAVRGIEDVLEILGDEGLERLLGILDLTLALESEYAQRTLQRVATVLGTLGDTRAIPCLLRLLDSDHTSVLEAAAIALSKMGTPSLEPLIEALAKQKGSARQAAVLALGELGDRCAVPYLLELLKSDRLPEVGGQAALALGSIGDRSVARTLEKHLVDPEPTVRWASAFALGQLSDSRSAVPLMHTLRDVEPRVAQAAAEALQKLGRTAVRQLVKELSSGKVETREVAAIALGHTKTQQAIPGLKVALSDSHPCVRTAAAIALGQMGDAIVSDLEEMLQHPKAQVRAAAAIALGYAGASQALPSLRQRLADEDPVARAGAMVALARFGEATGLLVRGNLGQRKSLLMRTGHSETETIKRAKATIEVLADEEVMPVSDVVDILASLLRDRNREIRQAAATALINLTRKANSSVRALKTDGVRIKTPLAVCGRAADMRQAVNALVELLGDRVWRIRKTAALALGQLEHECFGGMRILMWRFRLGTYEECQAIVEGLKVHRERAVEFLTDSLRCCEPKVREIAARTLGSWAENRAVMPLIETLKQADVSVRMAAVEALGRIGSRQAVEPLMQRVLEDPEPSVRLAAVQALTYIGDERAIETLRTASSDENEEIANAAYKGIERIRQQRTRI